MSKEEDYEIAEAMVANASYLQSILWEALSMRLFLKKKGLLDEYLEDKDIVDETDDLFEKAFKEVEKEGEEEE
ncbi:MAG: hypothetical protein QW279_00375 [Candidatus Jordarchaeaceae archaeon]